MFTRVVVLVLFAVSVASAAEAPPKVTLTVPQEFKTELSVKHFRKGQDVLNSPPYCLTTVAAMTEHRGYFGPRVGDTSRDHRWTIRVYRRFTQKVADAYASARDGFEADLNESPEFLGLESSSYMYARFERKRFPWGTGVSFFSQFTQDTGVYVPHNGHLTYEVWGVTPDEKYTVVGTVAVTHRKLADWGPEVRNARSIEALKRDRDYRLVEKCSAEDFEPSLTAFDRVVESLVIR